MWKLPTVCANILWFVSTIPATIRWYRATRNVARTQEEVLRDLVDHNSNTVFGKEHAFDTVATVREYQNHVPRRAYEGFDPYIKTIGNGACSVLTDERVKLLEPSSGTTGGKKLVPYTDSLQSEFQAGIDPWINRLYRKYPKMFLGKAYWSVAPVAEREYTQGGLPIGFATDAEYLGSLQQAVVGTVMAVPKEVSFLQEVGAFRYITALFLLATHDLTLISVWHPSFLTLLFDVLEQHAEDLTEDVRHGTISCEQVPQELRSVLEGKLHANKKRASEIGRIFQSWTGKPGTWKNVQGKTLYEKVWPRLSVVSCWGNAQARQFFDQLRAYFPNTYCEPKGLIATEGFVSFPVGGMHGSALSLLSHFFEFQEVDDSTAAKVLLAHELQVGHRYTVLLSTSGGLYRYDLGDIVEVLGFQAQCPIIRFVGKQASVVDVCGEKLTEVEVTEVVQQVFDEFGVMPDYWMLAPEVIDSNTVGYTLFFQNPQNIEFQVDTMHAIVREIDTGLERNFHYAYCRKLHQLQPIRVFVIDSGLNPTQQYLDTCHGEGQRLGNIKPRVLHPGMNWSTVFTGTYV